MATLVNEVEWYHANFVHRWGMGLCPSCPTPMDIPVRPVEILLRLSLARAYGVAEIDVFAFTSSNAEVFEIYWPMLKAIRGCDGLSADGIPGRCWPVLGGKPWWPHSCDNQTWTCRPDVSAPPGQGHAQCEVACKKPGAAPPPPWNAKPHWRCVNNKCLQVPGFAGTTQDNCESWCGVE